MARGRSRPPLAPPSEQLLAWKLALHGTPIEGRVAVRVTVAGAVYSRFPANAHVSLPRVAGHRDADSTECPGDALYGELPGVRLSAAHTQGTPARLTIAQQTVPAAAPAPATTNGPGAEPTPGASPAPTAPPVATAGPVAMLSGALTFVGSGAGGADGPPIPNAPIEIEACSVSRRGEVVQERTLAQAQTAADGAGRPRSTRRRRAFPHSRSARRCARCFRARPVRPRGLLPLRLERTFALAPAGTAAPSAARKS